MRWLPVLITCACGAPPRPQPGEPPATLEDALRAELGEPDAPYDIRTLGYRTSAQEPGGSTEDRLRAEVGEPDDEPAPDADDAPAWTPRGNAERRGPYLVTREDHGRYVKTCVSHERSRGGGLCGLKLNWTLRIRDVAWTGGPPRVGREASRLRNALSGVRWALEACQNARPEVTGTARGRLVVLPSGAVSDARVEGLADAQVSECLQRAVARAAFPPRPPSEAAVLVLTFAIVLEDLRADGGGEKAE